MNTTLPLDLSNRLQQRMEELLIEITTIKNYLGEPIDCGTRQQLPLGVIGQVMSSELQNETRDMAEQTHYMALEEGVDTWEKMKASVYLHRKIAMLITLVGIISQLPAINVQAHKLTASLFQRVIEQCHMIEAVLDALVSETITIKTSEIPST